MRRYAKSCLLLINVHADEECLSTLVYPDTEMLRAGASELNRLGYLHPPLARGRSLQDLRAEGTPAFAAGVFEGFTKVGPRRHVAVGWAGLPTRRGPADAVVLALEGPGGDWLPWRLEPVFRPRPDIARAMGSAYRGAGWRRPVPWPELPTRPFRIGAWAFDATTGLVTPLEGTHDVPADDADGH